jgi:hypothetical protein
MIGDDWGQPNDPLPVFWWVGETLKAIGLAVCALLMIAIIGGLAG